MYVFLTQKKSSLEESLEESRAELLALRTNHADTVGSLEAQVKNTLPFQPLCLLLLDNITSFSPQLSRFNCTITELQMLLRHKDDSSKAYKNRTDTQVNAQIVSAGMQE